MNIIIWAIQLTLVPFLSPLFVGIIRKIKARMQNRKGASVFQPYRDLWKLFHKDEVVSEDASWVFSFTPYLIFAVTIVIGASIPLFTFVFTNNLVADLLVIVYLIALSTFFLALAGIDTGSAFGGFASSREMTVASLTEAGLIFSFLVLALLAGSSNLFSISGSVLSVAGSNILPIFLAFSAFIIAMLAETARFPFDNPATHLELTMIHEAMILEYSGKKLALVEWAASNKLLIFMALAVNLFFPWGMALEMTVVSVLIAMGLFIAKVLVICVFIAVLESSIAKLRLFRLPNLLIISFVLTVIAISLI